MRREKRIAKRNPALFRLSSREAKYFLLDVRGGHVRADPLTRKIFFHQEGKKGTNLFMEAFSAFVSGEHVVLYLVGLREGA
jgi:hypothetical protein